MSLMSVPRIAARFLNTPLMIDDAKAAVIVSVLRSKLSITELSFTLDDGTSVTLSDAGMADLQSGAQAATRRGRSNGRDERSYDVIDGIAHIPVQGTLMKSWGLHPSSGSTGYDGLTVKLREAMADDDVKGIFWDIDSPGGEVAGNFDLVDEIWASNARNGGKLMYAHANEEAYSAAYSIASAADKVFVPRTGGTGSVGVIALHADMSKAHEAQGVKVSVLRAGKHKAEGNSMEPLADDTRARWMSELEDMRRIFAETVARNRGLSVKAVLGTEALTFMGQRGVEAGFATGVKNQTEAFAAMTAAIKRKS